MSHAPKFGQAIKTMRRGGFIFALMGVFMLAGSGMNKLASQRGSLIAASVFFILLACAFLIGFPAFNRRAIVKSYAQKPDRDMLITYELSEAGIKCRSDIATTELQWEAISRVVRTADGFLLYVTEMQVHWLPTHSFKNKDDLERFVQIAQAKAKQYEG